MSRTAALDARREQLLELGKQIFSARSYDEVSTEDIASEAGISIGLLYHYFRNKKGYYVATIRAAAAELVQATQLPEGLSLEVAVPMLIERFLDFIEANAALYVGLMRGGVGADPEVYAILEGVRTTILRQLFADPPPFLKLQLYGWFGYVEAVCLRWLTEKEVSRPELLDILSTAIPVAIFSEAAA